MTDPRLALPQELYVEVTNRCNSRCQTCVRTFHSLEPLRDLTLAEFRSLVDQLPLLDRAVLHGVGEPLLNHDLSAMIAYLKGRLQPPHVLFNSNAILLDPAWQASLIASDLDEFRVSIDAAQPALYARIRGVDALDQVLHNVETFARRIEAVGRGPQLSFWFTALRENLADLPDLVRLAHRVGVGQVYVQRLVYYGEGLAQHDQSLYDALHAAEEEVLARAEAEAEALGVSFRASGATTPRRSLSSSKDRERPWAACRRPWALTYITANGNVLPCCFSPFTTRDYAGLVLGNAFDVPLAVIWHGPAYQKLRTSLRSERPFEACDRCGVCWSL
jgi:MoaA/NifB/PqqE/SkfB family radical SAM enzyme